MKKDDKMLLIGLGGLGLVVFLNWDKIEEKLPELPSFGMPSFEMPALDLSGLFEGLEFPSLDLSGLGGGLEGFLGGISVPKLDLSALGLGLVPPSLPQIPDIPQLVKDALGIGGEGEEAVMIAPEPSEQTTGEWLKGFITQHPIISAAVGVPAVGALSYGIVKAAPYAAKGLGSIGGGIAKVSSNIYNAIKLPKGISIWKTVKIAPKAIKPIKPIAPVAGGGVGAAILPTMAFAGIIEGAYQIYRMIRGEKDIGMMGVPPLDIFALITGKSVLTSTKMPAVSAMPMEITPPTIILPRITGLEQYYGEYYEAGVKPPPSVPVGYEETPIAPARREVPSGYEEAPIRPAAPSPWIVPAGYREA